MKITLFSLVLACSALAQTNVAVGRMAMPPQESAAVDQWLTTQTTSTTAPIAGAIVVGDTTITLPAAIVAACSWNYPVVTLAVTSNVASATVETLQVPLGSRVTLSNTVTTPTLAGTFATTNAATNNNLITFAFTAANSADLSNTNVNTNGFLMLSLARCAVLIDTEVIGINGTSNGTSFTAIRGEMSTTAAAHASGAIVMLLKYPDKRHFYRQHITDTTGDILSRTLTAKEQTLISQIAALQAQLAAQQKGGAQ